MQRLANGHGGWPRGLVAVTGRAACASDGTADRIPAESDFQVPRLRCSRPWGAKNGVKIGKVPNSYGRICREMDGPVADFNRRTSTT